MKTSRFSFPLFLKFIRFKVSLAVTFSAWAAAVAASGGIFLSHLPGIAGIFLLACGASALNQVQEMKYDALMERTSGRPLPSGVLTLRSGLIISFFLIFSGLVILFFQNKMTFFLGMINISWYNGLYTWLKRKTAFAVVPGSFTGSIPLLMGWTVAGGFLTSDEPWLLASFMFLWQIPHFWLLMLKYGKQYQLAGLPVLPDIFAERQMKNIIFSWIMAGSVSSLLLVSYGIWHNVLIKLTILILNIILIFLTVRNLFLKENENNRQLFMMINVFMMLVMMLLVADQLLF